jgi:hypothetical protein
MVIALLTTVDNPHSPFEDWDAWFNWDALHGYHTPGLLARIAVTSHELSDKDFNLEIENAIDEIVRENVTGVHRKVTKEVPDPTES